MPTLFPRSSKGSLFRRAQADEQFDCPPLPPTHGGHRRKVSLASSLASTITRSSTESHRSKPGGSGGSSSSFGPLSCHPPLSINTSPHFDEDRWCREDTEREDRFFSPTAKRAQDHYQDTPELSPVKGENCFFHRDNRRRITYVYDQATQWPLKDWQTIPPGLADIDDLSSEPATPTTPRPPSCSHQRQRRPVEWMTQNPGSFFVKRGDWKRRGIVFHLDDDAEEEQEQHFPIEEPFEFPG